MSYRRVINTAQSWPCHVHELYCVSNLMLCAAASRHGTSWYSCCRGMALVFCLLTHCIHVYITWLTLQEEHGQYHTGGACKTAIVHNLSSAKEESCCNPSSKHACLHKTTQHTYYTGTSSVQQCATGRPPPSPTTRQRHTKASSTPLTHDKSHLS